ncbi:MAG: Gfo/Idh/MocA family oxidoreductase [Patescibacteria group bacterium]
MSEGRAQQKDKFRAIIVGAGNIASGFDSPKEKTVLTHAHAYTKNKEVQLIGFYDIDINKARRAAKKWNCQYFSELGEVFENVEPDIVSVCVDTKNHFQVLKELVKYKPRLVVCEKPLTENIQDAEKLLKIYKNNNIPISVNYLRRFDKTVNNIKREIESGKLGKILCASGIYSKGLLNYGSHLIDICSFLFGDFKKGKVNYSMADYDEKDRSIAGFLEFKKCKQFNLMIGDSRRYSMFELDIIFEKGRIKFFDFGHKISRQTVSDDSRYKGYKSLDKLLIKQTELYNSFPKLVNNAIKFLKKEEKLLSDLSSAYQTQKICNYLSNLDKKNV